MSVDNQGKRFQHAVARWLLKVLNLKHIELEELAEGKNGRYYADLYAQEHRPYIRWVLLALGLFALAFILLGSAVWLKWAGGNLPGNIAGSLPNEKATTIASGIVGLVCLIASLSSIWIGRRRQRNSHQTVWVECKDLKRPVPQAEVRKLLDAVSDVLSNDGADWHPDVVMMFSRHGYAEDALRPATDPNYQAVKQCEIRLYQQRGKKPKAFELVLYKR